MILGTAAYMAPEQARGKPVDKRADIWAFGVVLYEMLTGKRLFDGEDVSEILAAVIKGEPDGDAVPRSAAAAASGAWKKIRRSGCATSAMCGSCWTTEASAPTRSVCVRGPEVAGGSRRQCWRIVAASRCGRRGVAQAWLAPLVRLDVDLGADVVLAPAGPTRKQRRSSRPMGCGWCTASGEANQAVHSPTRPTQAPPNSREHRAQPLRFFRPTATGSDSSMAR